MKYKKFLGQQVFFFFADNRDIIGFLTIHLKLKRQTYHRLIF